MTLRISINMHKGGVGKSTTAMNLVGALNDLGAETLLVDIDPQGHTTKALGHDIAYLQNSTSLYDILLDVDKFEQISDIIVEHPETDLMPAHINMFQLERELLFKGRTEERLGMVLDRFDHSYDIIVMDSPPNLGPLTDNTILAAQNVLFPVQAQRSSQDALDMLFDEIETLEAEFDVPVQMLAAVVNQVSRDGMAEDMVDWYTEQFGEYVYEVPDRVALRYAWENHCTIFGYQPKRYEEEVVADLRDSYRDLATLVLNEAMEVDGDV